MAAEKIASDEWKYERILWDKFEIVKQLEIEAEANAERYGTSSSPREEIIKQMFVLYETEFHPI